MYRDVKPRKAGLQTGDPILSINGVDLEERTRKVFDKGAEVFRKARGSMQFIVRYEPIHYNLIIKKINEKTIKNKTKFMFIEL